MPPASNIFIMKAPLMQLRIFVQSCRIALSRSLDNSLVYDTMNKKAQKRITKNENRQMKRIICFGPPLMGLLLLLISGCASPISSEVKREADKSLDFVRVLENPPAYHGVTVIWGGVIMKVVNRSGGSALFIQETPLDNRDKPRSKDYTDGLFIARTQEFLDTKEYTSGRRVTISGEIIGEQLGKYKGTPYVYPVIKSREIHLWEREPEIKWDWANVPFYVPEEFSPDEEETTPLP